MPTRSRLRAAGRAGFGRLPGGVRSRLLAPAARIAGLSGADVGLVSVVVVAEPGDRLDECLASVRAQTHGLLDVVVCPVAGAEVVLPDDPRLRALPPTDTTYDAANAGLQAATGEHVVLVRGCDVLLPHGVAALAGARAESGSDLATGVLVQAGEAEPWLARAQADAHAVTGRGLPATPALTADLTLANKAFSGDLARRLHLTETDHWLCSPALAQLLSGLTVDVLDRPVARYAHDRGRRPYGAQPSPLPELDVWVHLDALVSAAVAGSLLEPGWRRHWCDVVLPRFLEDAERADLPTWQRLVSLAQASDHRDLDVRASARSLLRLAAEQRRGDVEALAAELISIGDDVPTELTDVGLVARYASVSLPDEARRLGEHETRLVARVVRRTPAHVDLWVRIPGLDLSHHPLTVTVTTDDDLELEIAQEHDAAADRWAGTRFWSAAEGALRVSVPPTVDRLHVEVNSGPLLREALVPLPRLRPAPPAGDLPAVLAVRLEGDELVVDVDGAADGLRLVGGGYDVLGEQQRDGTVRFVTRCSRFGRAAHLPTAHYRLEREGGIAADPSWRDRLPVESLGTHHRLRVLPQADSPGELHLGPPRTDGELGAYGQEQLRASYALDHRPTDPAVWYFESFAGRSATDTPLAVCSELVRRAPGLTPVWGVLDHGHWTPPGARPVVIGSREWYDVLGTARVLVTNTELEGWYRRRPDQLVVQCFHGYPSKAMGDSQWRARQLPPRRIAEMRRRSVDTWDLISTPTPEMTGLYREQYGYRGPAAEHGYPRDDALRGASSATLREEARSALGIEPSQTAVLYAPTWRDHLATRPRGAAMSDFLDPRAFASSLGESHVLLVRGHRFHASGASMPGVIDVTDHPEVNELILASDAAVLDYSSLRFDYALTGRPMVFLVPDLASYTSGLRGFLFPFEDTAPGPFVSTTAEVVSLVRDVPALAAEWGPRVAAFDAVFNPHQDGHAAERMLDAILELLA